ncbi:hypothetical protein Trydic_g17622 [Trypoxylus dichotomus]
MELHIQCSYRLYQLPVVVSSCRLDTYADIHVHRPCGMGSSAEDHGVERRPPRFLPQDAFELATVGGTGLGPVPPVGTSFTSGRFWFSVSESGFRETLRVRCCLLDGGRKPSESVAASSEVFLIVELSSEYSISDDEESLASFRATYQMASVVSDLRAVVVLFASAVPAAACLRGRPDPMGVPATLTENRSNNS